MSAHVVAPDDATKCQNWLKIRGGVVSGHATPRYCRCVDQTLCTDVTMLVMSRVCVEWTYSFKLVWDFVNAPPVPVHSLWCRCRPL